ncbi:hypothetical protein GE061_018466 [Apolygus lucorum]|uniref:Uncharacterized protein n=1 Tax=Apolygus lucorum TaxID=248454 RepID=A0A8S9XGP4_APOLU|nr:hypothetical protein GE061_018466 [Apolygus lucorum]
MDSFIDFFTDDPLPNCGEQPAVDEHEGAVSFETIDRFRESLLERNNELQLAGLNGLIGLLKSPEHVSQWRDAFVEANVIETLAETISSLNTHVVRTSISLLEELIQSKVFAEQNRASVIVNSILRCVLIFSEVSDDGVVVKMGLDLVSKIIMIMVGEGKEFQTFCSLDQLIHVTQTILKSPNENLSILQSVSQIVYTVLLSSKALLEGDSEREVGFPHLVAEVVNQLCRATHSNPDIDIDTAICEVGAACMRLLVKSSGIRKDVLEPLHAMIRTAMIKLIVPHINEWVLQTDHTSIGEMITLLKGVISLYHYPDAVEKFKYTKQLVESNFLEVLHSLEFICRTWMQFMVVRSLLVEIIVCLCTNELGEFNWSAIVTESLKTLPVQGSLSRLETYSFQDPLSTTIIIYNYFLLTNSECPEITVDLFKDICTHVNLSQSPIPPPVFKAVWLCFAVGFLTHGDTCYLAEKTNCTITSLLTTAYDIEKVFTHHPAILYWTFRSENILKDVKTSVMNLWIKIDDETTIRELKSLLAQSREAFSAYLELLPSQNLDEESIAKHLSIFPDLLQLCDEHFIELVSYDAWSMLPQVLLHSCLRVETLGVIPLLVFCCEFQPDLIDQDLLLRIACLVPGTISKHNSISTEAPASASSSACSLKYIVIFKFMWVLFNKVQERNESMILSPLLNHENFIFALEYSLTLKHDELTVIVLELLTTMLSLQKKHSTISRRSVVISGEDLAKLLYTNGGVATAAVKMLHCLLTADDVIFSPRLLVIIERPQVHLRATYIRIHMICSLGIDELSSLCWTILHRLLLYSQDACSLEHHLPSLPYTHDLLRTCAPGTLSWEPMVRFLSIWLPCQPPSARERSLGNVALDETLLRLAQTEISL